MNIYILLFCCTSPYAWDGLAESTGGTRTWQPVTSPAPAASRARLAAATLQIYGPLAKQLGGIADSPRKIALVNHTANSLRGRESSWKDPLTRIFRDAAKYFMSVSVVCVRELFLHRLDTCSSVRPAYRFVVRVSEWNAVLLSLLYIDVTCWFYTLFFDSLVVSFDTGWHLLL